MTCCQSLDTVANALHLLLWAPQDLIIGVLSGPAPPEVSISWWLVKLAAVTCCYQHGSYDSKSQDAAFDTTIQSPVVSSSLRRIFLSRVNSRDVIDAQTLLRIYC